MCQQQHLKHGHVRGCGCGCGCGCAPCQRADAHCHAVHHGCDRRHHHHCHYRHCRCCCSLSCCCRHYRCCGAACASSCGAVFHYAPSSPLTCVISCVTCACVTFCGACACCAWQICLLAPSAPQVDHPAAAHEVQQLPVAAASPPCNWSMMYTIKYTRTHAQDELLGWEQKVCARAHAAVRRPSQDVRLLRTGPASCRASAEVC
jgi:hypothetical protein